MSRDKITLKNIKNISNLSVEFDFPVSNIIVVTGKNGVGKTSIVKAFHLVNDPLIFQKSAGLRSIRQGSEISFEIDGFQPFTFRYDNNQGALDSKDELPNKKLIFAELPIPYGNRFNQFSLIAKHDNEIRINIATTQYAPADELINFLSMVYASDKFNHLNATIIDKNTFYFVLRDQDYYVREDHLSSGEFFLIQLFRLITSGAKLVIIDELDVALDAAAQVKLYAALKPILQKYQTRLIVISHSLAFMSTIDDGSLYYLEEGINGAATLEQRSFGYVKSDLYGFRGKDRYIITEDEVLVGFINFLILHNIQPFYEYEIIAVGGQPQIDAISIKNDMHNIFCKTQELIIIVDKDIRGQLRYRGSSQVLTSPVDDIELFIWSNKDSLLPDITHPTFTPARRDKDTAKTYWKKLLSSGQKTKEDLYLLVTNADPQGTQSLVNALRTHLCFP